MLIKLFKYHIFAFVLLLLISDCELIENKKVDSKPVKYHTYESEGLWQGKADSHMPIVSLNKVKNTIDIRVPLKPKKNPRHYIEVIVLMYGNRQIAVKKNSFSFYEAKAEFKLPKWYNKEEKQSFWVFAKCNNHGMWRTALSEN